MLLQITFNCVMRTLQTNDCDRFQWLILIQSMLFGYFVVKNDVKLRTAKMIRFWEVSRWQELMVQTFNGIVCCDVLEQNQSN